MLQQYLVIVLFLILLNYLKDHQNQQIFQQLKELKNRKTCYLCSKPFENFVTSEHGAVHEKCKIDQINTYIDRMFKTYIKSPCMICNRYINYKVRDHCHATSKYLGAVHNIYNSNR